jgi:rare lipoprotein A
MNRSILFYLILSLFVFSCARNTSYVKVIKPPDSKTITLPEKTDEIISDSYEVNGERYYRLPDSVGFVQTGMASWYGKDFHGRLTANGEVYDMHRLTAAHKTLPLGTFVDVENLSNHRKIIVQINDRGPFVKGRILDLSYEAAKRLQIIGPGVAEVRITALGKEIGESKTDEGPKPLIELKELNTGEFTVQVGAFSERNNAERLADRLRVIFDYVNILEYMDKDKTLFRLHVSKSKSLAEAGEKEKKLEDLGFKSAFIVRL